MNTRAELRAKSADYLNDLSLNELFERFAITRVSKIDGLDCIGVPVYSVCRPAAKVVSVNAGKNRDALLARAGAIAEGIEFSVFENPVGGWRMGIDLPIDHNRMPTCQGADLIQVAVEPAIHYVDREECIMPSDMIWIDRRLDTGSAQFQMSSNGQAIGATFEDAFLQGLYECVERDQVTLRSLAFTRFHVWPPKIEFDLELKDKCEDAGLKLYLFYLTHDIPFPVYAAILVDPFGGAGTFGGWGCDLNPHRAAERALLEAIQSRAVYISGSRDDIERRDYSILKSMEPRDMILEIESLPFSGSLPEYGRDHCLEKELEHAIELMGPWTNKIFYKHIDLRELHAVKVIVLGLEQPRGKLFRSMRFDKMVCAPI